THHAQGHLVAGPQTDAAAPPRGLAAPVALAPHGAPGRMGHQGPCRLAALLRTRARRPLAYSRAYQDRGVSLASLTGDAATSRACGRRLGHPAGLRRSFSDG